jgi:hypothetical protein
MIIVIKWMLDIVLITCWAFSLFFLIESADALAVAFISSIK